MRSVVSGPAGTLRLLGGVRIVRGKSGTIVRQPSTP